MKRTIVIWCLLLPLLSGLLLFANVQANEPAVFDAEAVFERSGDAVFYLRILRDDDSVKATGTGVVLTPGGLAATAYHVVKDGERLEGVFPDGRTVSPIKVVGYDEATDAALIELPEPAAAQKEQGGYAAVPQRGSALKYGEKVFAIGYPMANTPIITEGIVSSPKAEINGRDRVLISAQVASGMSGGPVLDRYGNLAGIVSGSLRTINNIHLVIPMEDMRSLLPN
ncbi:serine protease [Paenibacillus hodogayensis]|uniref:Serine protease n=1 Tax=Paenibacillus hodogayensis TaxID=279208 RepID=A0ABV5VTA7_9BACL